MGCKGCNVVMPTGPTGATGASGANGSNGSNGSDGANGTTNLFSNTTLSSPSVTTGQDISNYSYTLPLDTLSAAGDSIVVKYCFTSKAATSSTVDFTFGGSTILSSTSYSTLLIFKVELRIIRLSVGTSIKVIGTVEGGSNLVVYPASYLMNSFSTNQLSNAISITDLTTNNKVCSLFGTVNTGAATDLEINYMTIDLIKQ